MKNSVALRRAGPGEIWLDLSRLPWRAWKGRLTGIDRVELAYARHMLDAAGDRLRFVAFDYRSGFRELPRNQTERLVRVLGQAWGEGDGAPAASLARSVFLSGISPLSPKPGPVTGPTPPAYVNVSMHPLCQEWAVSRFLRRTGAAFVPLMHDMIPSEHPEYVPTSWTARHLRRLRTISHHAQGVIANSQATADALQGHLGTSMPIAPLLLGVEARPMPAGDHPPFFSGGRPYFVFLGTIEPRKNHLTVLHAWRSMVMRLGRDAAPGLLVIGARGWDNEQVLDILERCSLLRGIVVEAGRLSDDDVSRAMAGARALVMPSFAEGYGLPVAESLVSGCPVICSDIPAHREVGGMAPDYIDATDGPAWAKAVEDFAMPRSSRRAEALMRMRSWRPVQWSDHVVDALRFVDDVARSHALASERRTGFIPSIRIGRIASTSDRPRSSLARG